MENKLFQLLCLHLMPWLSCYSSVLLRLSTMSEVTLTALDNFSVQQYLNMQAKTHDCCLISRTSKLVKNDGGLIKNDDYKINRFCS
jgi:hypothetical protein